MVILISHFHAEGAYTIFDLQGKVIKEVKDEKKSMLWIRLILVAIGTGLITEIFLMRQNQVKRFIQKYWSREYKNGWKMKMKL